MKNLNLIPPKLLLILYQLKLIELMFHHLKYRRCHMKVGLIAGDGIFPLEVAKSISQKNKEIFIIAIKGSASKILNAIHICG